MVIITSVLALAFLGVVRTVLPAMVQMWWALPLSVSITSAAALVLSAALRNDNRGRKLLGLSTHTYLVSGPSLAALNVLSVLPLGSSPPAWVGNLMLLLFFCSAWLYYKTVKEPEEAGNGGWNRESLHSV